MKHKDGDKVNCQKCGKSLDVKVHSLDKLSVMTFEYLQEIALCCQDCGYIACATCCSSGTDAQVPTCPSCGSEGGPLPHTREYHSNYLY